MLLTKLLLAVCEDRKADSAKSVAVVYGVPIVFCHTCLTFSVLLLVPLHYGFIAFLEAFMFQYCRYEKGIIFKCYFSEKLIALNTLHEGVLTWYLFHS